MVFILIDTKHKPPDLLDLDPELLRTLNLPDQTSIDSPDSDTNLAMLDNWEMNEVFQDISSILNVRGLICHIFYPLQSGNACGHFQYKPYKSYNYRLLISLAFQLVSYHIVDCIVLASCDWHD